MDYVSRKMLKVTSKIVTLKFSPVWAWNPNTQVKLIEQGWHTICDEAHLSEIDRNYFWRRQFLNPFAFYGTPEDIRIPQG